MMRAKMQVGSLFSQRDKEGNVVSENLTFFCVAKSGGYPADGSDEDNTFARWSPSGRLEITIANPALFGKHEVGQKYYVDFTLVPDAVSVT